MLTKKPKGNKRPSVEKLGPAAALEALGLNKSSGSSAPASSRLPASDTKTARGEWWFLVKNVSSIARNKIQRTPSFFHGSQIWTIQLYTKVNP